MYAIRSYYDYEGISYTYNDATKLIYQIHGFFEQCQIQKGDKVALLGRNSSHWGITFIAIISYGAVAVPILPDFNPADVHHIVRHSESKILFAGEQLLEKLSLDEMPGLKAALSLQRMDPIWAENTQILRITSYNVCYTKLLRICSIFKILTVMFIMPSKLARKSSRKKI